MGLDISVKATVEQVLDEGKYELEDHPELRRAFVGACERLGLKPSDGVHSRPGSYAGMHRLRTAYGKHMGVDTGKNNTDWQDGALPESHLIHHSDCDGWYLPSEWEEPIWARAGGDGFVSIGSSVKLLAELRSFEPAKYGVQWEWDAVFVAAVASVMTREPIRFG